MIKKKYTVSESISISVGDKAELYQITHTHKILSGIGVNTKANLNLYMRRGQTKERAFAQIPVSQISNCCFFNHKSLYLFNKSIVSQRCFSFMFVSTQGEWRCESPVFKSLVDKQDKIVMKISFYI